MWHLQIKKARRIASLPGGDNVAGVEVGGDSWTAWTVSAMETACFFDEWVVASLNSHEALEPSRKLSKHPSGTSTLLESLTAVPLVS